MLLNVLIINVSILYRYSKLIYTFQNIFIRENVKLGKLQIKNLSITFNVKG